MTVVRAPALRRLLMEAALAATQHGMRDRAESLLDALPEWTDEGNTRLLCRALLLIGLGREAEAARCLEGAYGLEADRLRRALHGGASTAMDDGSGRARSWP